MKIKVKDSNSGTVFKEFSKNESEAAYAYASEMEELGIDVAVVEPTVTESLGSALGVDTTQIQKMEDSIRHEIEEHDESDSCCFKETDKSKLH